MRKQTFRKSTFRAGPKSYRAYSVVGKSPKSNSKNKKQLQTTDEKARAVDLDLPPKSPPDEKIEFMRNKKAKDLQKAAREIQNELEAKQRRMKAMKDINSSTSAVKTLTTQPVSSASYRNVMSTRLKEG